MAFGVCVCVVPVFVRRSARTRFRWFSYVLAAPGHFNLSQIFFFHFLKKVKQSPGTDCYVCVLVRLTASKGGPRLYRRAGEVYEHIWPGTDLPGNDLDAGGYLGRVKGNKASLYDCALACMAHQGTPGEPLRRRLSECNSVTWVKSEKGGRDNCALKTRQSYEDYIDRGGTWHYRRVGISRGDPSSCCDSMDLDWMELRERNGAVLDGLMNKCPVGELSFLRADSESEQYRQEHRSG